MSFWWGLAIIWGWAILLTVGWGWYVTWRDRRADQQTRLTLVRRYREAESHESEAR